MNNIFETLNKLSKQGKDVVLVTVTEKEGMGPADVGKKMLVDEDNNAIGTVGGGAIEFYAREKCKQVIKERKSFTEKYMLYGRDVYPEGDEIPLDMVCGGKVTLFYEFVGPKQHVYIFGAGHCGAALAKTLKPLGFHITIIEERESVINSLDDSCDEKVNVGFVEYIEKYGLKPNAYLVVCTPSHTNDYHVLNKVLEIGYNPSYFGMLCSKKKIGEYMQKANEIYGNDLNLQNFYSPIGLDIGGNSPEEIAISIAGEMLSVYYKKEHLNSHLRNTVPDNEKYFE
ncbi:MAG: XdhC family protein [Bacilli bacterium]|nr:XdhC family protein [Bacilli bacterium]